MREDDVNKARWRLCVGRERAGATGVGRGMRSAANCSGAIRQWVVVAGGAGRLGGDELTDSGFVCPGTPDRRPRYEIYVSPLRSRPANENDIYTCMQGGRENNVHRCECI